MILEMWKSRSRFTPGCPNKRPTIDRLRQALDRAGLHTVGFTSGWLTAKSDTERLGVTGSPTVLIGGSNAFGEFRDPPLACCLYRSHRGLAGDPDIDQRQQALHANRPPAGRTPGRLRKAGQLSGTS